MNVPSITPPGAAQVTSRKTRHRQLWITFFMALIVLVPSLLGFGNKFREFILLFRGDVDGVFAISPIVNYLLAALGFFCMFGWALFHGMFYDIEQPKRQFLETERDLDRQLPNPPIGEN